MSIHRLEPAKQFVTRMVLLNRFHAPDEDDYEEARHALGAIHKGFPRAEPARQSAYIVSAVMAGQPFREANYRTAFDYVADMLAHAGYDLHWTLKDQQDLGSTLWGYVEQGDEAAVEAYAESWFKPRIHKGTP